MNRKDQPTSGLRQSIKTADLSLTLSCGCNRKCRVTWPPNRPSVKQASEVTSSVRGSTSTCAGAILYEMLTGRGRFGWQVPRKLSDKVISEHPALPSRLNVNVPRDLETICLKCLSKKTPRVVCDSR